jgi:hypothetical protein
VGSEMCIRDSESNELFRRGRFDDFKHFSVYCTASTPP